MTHNKENYRKIAYNHALQALLESAADKRVDLIEKEFQNGYAALSNYPYTVTVFGSARFTEDNKYYQLARQTGTMLAEENFTVITGGGGGIMEAANRGAFESGGEAVGLNIELPHEQQLNPYTTDSIPFHYFFARKVMLVYSASALICFPGGYGTLDELFEVMTLVQTGKTAALPIILVGSDFWKPLDDLIRTQLLEVNSAISPGDEDLYTITDDVEKVRQIVIEFRKAFAPLALESPHE